MYSQWSQYSYRGSNIRVFHFIYGIYVCGMYVKGNDMKIRNVGLSREQINLHAAMLPQPHTYLHYIRSRLKLMFGIYVPYPNIQRTHKHEECFCVKAGAVYRYCLYLCTSYVEMYLMFTLLCVRIEIGRLFLFCFFFS